MTTPKVSVVVATCGRPELVLDCIDSILKNDFDDYEVLVVDQDPARGLDPLLGKRFGKDPRVRYFFLEPPGLSRARNTGLEHARGQFVVFIDDDAEVERSWIRAYVDAFTSIHPTPGLVAGQIVPLWLSAKPSWYPEEREYLLGPYTEKGGDLIPMPAVDFSFWIRARCRNTIGVGTSFPGLKLGAGKCRIRFISFEMHPNTTPSPSLSTIATGKFQPAGRLRGSSGRRELRHASGARRQVGPLRRSGGVQLQPAFFHDSR